MNVLRYRRIDLLLALSIAALALFVYNATLTPSLSYKSPDGNELATVPYVLGLAHATGYPLYTWLGKLFTFIPVGDVAHRVNLMSAVLGAGTVGGLFLILRVVTGKNGPEKVWRSRLAAALAALSLAFSRTFWSQAGIAEVYAPNAFMIVLTLGLLLAWARAEERGQARRSNALFLLFCASFGLSLGTHLSNLGFALAFAVFVLLVNWRVLLSPVKLLGGTAAFALGVVQFLWLPYKAHTLNDRAMLRDAPDTLSGIYRYTLGAFPQFKFAFPLSAIPDRIVIYLDLLWIQFHWWGVALGLLGMWVTLFRWPRHFFLFVLMYLVHLFFFVQYAVFDLDVFFIPAHLLFALFIGVGVWGVGGWMGWLVGWLTGWLGGWLDRRWVVVGGRGMAALASALLVVGQVQVNWAHNDYSDDTIINDFYENVWRLLPEDAVLMGQGGVFGYDMFYWRLVYDVRPDVLLPHLPTPDPRPADFEGREIYTTVRLDGPRARRGPGSLPPNLVDSHSWHVPVLVAGGGGASPAGRARELILYHVTDRPPLLVVTDPDPQVRLNADLGGLVLVGFDLADGVAVPGGVLELKLYWRLERPRRYLVATALGEEELERHEVGFGNLSRYVESFHPPSHGVVVEDYRIVIPSTTQAGEHALRIGLTGLRPNETSNFTLTTINIQPTNGASP